MPKLCEKNNKVSRTSPTTFYRGSVNVLQKNKKNVAKSYHQNIHVIITHKN